MSASASASAAAANEQTPLVGNAAASEPQTLNNGQTVPVESGNGEEIKYVSDSNWHKAAVVLSFVFLGCFLVWYIMSVRTRRNPKIPHHIRTSTRAQFIGTGPVQAIAFGLLILSFIGVIVAVVGSQINSSAQGLVSGRKPVPTEV